MTKIHQYDHFWITPVICNNIGGKKYIRIIYGKDTVFPSLNLISMQALIDIRVVIWMQL